MKPPFDVIYVALSEYRRGKFFYIWHIKTGTWGCRCYLSNLIQGVLCDHTQLMTSPNARYGEEELSDLNLTHWLRINEPTQ